MEDPEITDTCSKECLPNCGEITYSYEMDTTDLEVDQLCHNNRDTRDVINYRVVHLVEVALLLTLQYESCFSIRRSHCVGTCNLMSTNSVP